MSASVLLLTAAVAGLVAALYFWCRAASPSSSSTAPKPQGPLKLDQFQAARGAREEVLHKRFDAAVEAKRQRFLAKQQQQQGSAQ